MIKIDKIIVNGYKNIEKADLELNNFNVIIGANNSGKSNFIQVIPFLNYVINSSLDDVQKSFTKGFNATVFKEIAPFITVEKMQNKGFNREGYMEFELNFSNSNTGRVFVYQIGIEWKSEMFQSSFTIKSEKLDVKLHSKPGPLTNIFNRTYEKVKYGSDYSKMGVLEVIPKHFSVVRFLKILPEVSEEYNDAIESLNEILKTQIFYFSHIELLKTEKERLNSFNGRVVSFELTDEIKLLEEGNSWDIFKEALKDILNIEDVHVIKIGGDSSKSKIPMQKFLSFRHNGISKMLEQFSDGTILIIALVTKILSSNKNHLFLIEEPENSTHPKALIDLIAFLKSFSENTQFIITSHSIAILNKTKVDDIIASILNENGMSELFNVSNKKDLKAKLKKSSVNFSDELFFNLDTENEFE